MKLSVALKLGRVSNLPTVWSNVLTGMALAGGAGIDSRLLILIVSFSLLYVGGFIVARYILQRLSREARFKFTAEDVEQLILWLLVGNVIGARVIHCFVYDPRSLLQDPLYLLRV